MTDLELAAAIAARIDRGDLTYNEERAVQLAESIIRARASA